MYLGARIDYWGNDVATFDPEKVVWRLLEVFPAACIDWTDRAEKEVASLDQFLEKSDSSPEVKDTMRRQIRGKARRNGPCYRFRFDDGDGHPIDGRAGRYSVCFRSEEIVNEDTRRRLIDFLKSLSLGKLHLT
jgi:hypothetical protein